MRHQPRQKRQKCLIICLLLFSAFLFTGEVLGQDGGRSVRVGVFQLPPMVFMDDAGNADGFYIDLIKEVAARENWQLTFVPGTGPRVCSVGAKGPSTW